MDTHKVEIPKRKQNYFFVFDKANRKYNEVKYLNQHELAEGYQQIIPHNNNKKLINHFSITLCFLPEHLWSKLKKHTKNGEESYKTIKDGVTLYSIVETNQDHLMLSLYQELNNKNPDLLILDHYIKELDDSQYSSWLVMRARHYIKTGRLFDVNYINDFEEIKINYIK